MIRVLNKEPGIFPPFFPSLSKLGQFLSMNSQLLMAKLLVSLINVLLPSFLQDLFLRSPCFPFQKSESRFFSPSQSLVSVLKVRILDFHFFVFLDKSLGSGSFELSLSLALWNLHILKRRLNLVIFYPVSFWIQSHTFSCLHKFFMLFLLDRGVFWVFDEEFVGNVFLIDKSGVIVQPYKILFFIRSLFNVLSTLHHLCSCSVLWLHILKRMPWICVSNRSKIVVVTNRPSELHHSVHLPISPSFIEVPFELVLKSFLDGLEGISSFTSVESSVFIFVKLRSHNEVVASNRPVSIEVK